MIEVYFKFKNFENFKFDHFTFENFNNLFENELILSISIKKILLYFSYLYEKIKIGKSHTKFLNWFKFRFYIEKKSNLRYIYPIRYKWKIKKIV